MALTTWSGHEANRVEEPAAMLIVPVIDIKAGNAVRAVGGLRAQYEPVRSALCRSAQPADLLQAYLELHPFPVVYLADLDAITGQGSNRTLVQTLLARFPRILFWIDAGFRSNGDLVGYERQGRSKIVLGSESLTTARDYETLRTACQTEPILSLDFRHGSFLGPVQLLAGTTRWPKEVIVMALDNVGRDCGPSALPVPVSQRAGSCRVYAAGGIRGLADLRRLQHRGYSGALVASALLDRRLGSTELAMIANLTPPPRRRGSDEGGE